MRGESLVDHGEILRWLRLDNLPGYFPFTAGVFPLMLYSTLAPGNSLSAYQMAAAGHGLAIALVWWPIALILAIVYFAFIYRHYSGKVKLAQDMQRPY